MLLVFAVLLICILFFILGFVIGRATSLEGITELPRQVSNEPEIEQEAEPTPAPQVKDTLTPTATVTVTATATTVPEPDEPEIGDFKGQGFAVQVTSVRQKESAERLMNNLKQKDYPVYLDEKDLGDGRSNYRVRVGPFKTRREAREAEENLKNKENMDTWLVEVVI